MGKHKTKSIVILWRIDKIHKTNKHCCFCWVPWIMYNLLVRWRCQCSETTKPYRENNATHKKEARQWYQLNDDMSWLAESMGSRKEDKSKSKSKGGSKKKGTYAHWLFDTCSSNRFQLSTVLDNNSRPFHYALILEKYVTTLWLWLNLNQFYLCILRWTWFHVINMKSKLLIMI